MGNKWEALVRNKINESLQILTEKGHPLQDMSPIMVRYNMSGHVAGRAIYKYNLIKLNGGLLNRNTEYFINNTVPHEVAHLVAFFLNHNYRTKPHGNEWRGLMGELGLSPHRTHTYETVPASGTNCNKMALPYRYKCECREMVLSQTRHKRHMQAGPGRGYRCKRCRTKLQYVGVVSG